MQATFNRFRANFHAGSDLVVGGWALVVSAVALGLASALLITGGTLHAPAWAVLVLVAFAIAAERQPVRITSNTEITVSVLPILFAAVVFGPLAAMAVGALGHLADFRRPYSRWLIWTGMRGLSAGMAGVVAVTVLDGSETVGRLLAATAAAALADAVVDVLLGSATVALRGSGSFVAFIKSVRPVFFASVPLYTPVIVLLAYAYREFSVWSALLFFAPAFAAHALYRLYREEREATEKLTAVNAQLERANMSFATALVATLDARDRYTAGHSAAVAVYARDIAARMGLSPEDQQLIHLCGLVHDIGKIGLSAGLLEKPGPLTLEERRQMEKHPEIGERILSNVEDYAEIARVVRHHHERVDGEGYPDGLAGDKIPLLSRIIAVADAYNAMTSDRPYRDAMQSRVARLRLAQSVESQFDTSVVAAFEALLASGNEAYRSGTHLELSPLASDERKAVA